MVALWFPKEELKADLEDQARKRLEEIQREAEKRRNQITEAAQAKLNDEQLQAAMSRFNDMVDPLISKGREAIDGASQMTEDVGARARQLVDEAQQSINQAPTLDQIGPSVQQAQQPAPLPTPGLDGQTPPPLPAPTPPTPSPSFPGMDGLSDGLGNLGQMAQNGLDSITSQAKSAFTPPGLGGLGPTPPSPAPPGIAPSGMDGMPPPPSLPEEPQGPMGFKAPGMPGLPGMDGLSGLGSTLADRMRGAPAELGAIGGQRRDEALEVANKSLDLARDAMNNAGTNLGQTPIGRAARQALPGGAMDLLTGPSPASRTAEAVAAWTPEMEREQQAWESLQGTEREGQGLEGLLSGAGHAARRYEQQTREQGETLAGQGTQGEGPLDRAKAGFGYGLAGYGVIPEVARGGVESATGSPLAGAVAYGAASVLGPGGIAKFLRESGPLALRMATNLPEARQIASAAGGPATLKALALGLVGGVGGTGYGVKTGIDALREGKTPQEAAAIALTNAADILQISEAAGIPIDAGARVWRALPKMPRLPGQPAPPEAPGAPTPGELPPPLGQEGTLAPERTPEDEGFTPGAGLDGVAPGRPAATTPARVRGPLEEGAELPQAAGESYAQQVQGQRDVADDAVARAEARRGPVGRALDAVRRFGENLAGPEASVFSARAGAAPAPDPLGEARQLRPTGSLGGLQSPEFTATMTKRVAPGMPDLDARLQEFASRPRSDAEYRATVRELFGNGTTAEKELLAEYKPPKESDQAPMPQAFDPAWNPRLKVTTNPNGDRVLTLPSGTRRVVSKDGAVLHEDTRKAPTHEEFLRGMIDDYAEIRDPRTGERPADFYPVFGGHMGREVSEGQTPEAALSARRQMFGGWGATTAMTPPPHNLRKSLTMAALTNEFVRRREDLGLPARMPTGDEVQLMLRTGKMYFVPKDRNNPARTIDNELPMIEEVPKGGRAQQTIQARLAPIWGSGDAKGEVLNLPRGYTEVPVVRNKRTGGTITADTEIGGFAIRDENGDLATHVLEPGVDPDSPDAQNPENWVEITHRDYQNKLPGDQLADPVPMVSGVNVGSDWVVDEKALGAQVIAQDDDWKVAAPGKPTLMKGRGKNAVPSWRMGKTGSGGTWPTNETRAVVRAISNNQFKVEGGPKGTTFAHTSERAPGNEYNPLTVNDIQMADGFGFLRDKMANSATAHRFMTEKMRALGQELGLSPQEVQAIWWAAIRAEIGNAKQGEPVIHEPSTIAGQRFNVGDPVASGSWFETAGQNQQSIKLFRRATERPLKGDYPVFDPQKGEFGPPPRGTIDTTTLDYLHEGTPLSDPYRPKARGDEQGLLEVSRGAFTEAEKTARAIANRFAVGLGDSAVVGPDGLLGAWGWTPETPQIAPLRDAMIQHDADLTPDGRGLLVTLRDTGEGTVRRSASIVGRQLGLPEVRYFRTDPQGQQFAYTVSRQDFREYSPEEAAALSRQTGLPLRRNPDGTALYVVDDGRLPDLRERLEALQEAEGPNGGRVEAERITTGRVGADEYADAESTRPRRAALSASPGGDIEAGPGGDPGRALAGEPLAPLAPVREPSPVYGITPRGGRDGALRDTLDERLQIGQGLVGAAVGAQRGEEYDEEDEGLARALRILGGALGGGIAGVNAPNARRLLRAAQNAGASLDGMDGTLGAVSKGPPTTPVPESGKQGEDVGLGDLDDPDNLAYQILNPPQGGWQGKQREEMIRAMARRVKDPKLSAPGAQAEGVEIERGRRLVRRQQGIQKVEQATTPEEVEDAASEAQQAAERGEMPHSDADAVRGHAARKLQGQKGEDGPPAPGEMDRRLEAARARTEASRMQAQAREREREGLGVARPESEELPRREPDPYEDVEAGGTPVDDPAHRAWVERERARNRPGPLPPPLEPPVGREDTPPPQGEPHPGRGPELDPAARAVELPPPPARVTSGSKAERDRAAARAAYERRPSARIEATSPVTSLDTEASLRARATEPAERGIPRLIAPDGTLLTRAQAAAQLARDAARPGGWAAIRDEWNEGLSDGAKMLAAAGRGIRVAPKEFDQALAQVGRGVRGLGNRETWEGLPKNAQEKLNAWRPEHIFDAMGTYQRMNMVVTPEGFGRNFLSTSIGLPLRFYEAATAPLFDRAWGVLPGQGDRGPNAAHSYEAVAMAEGMYRSWAAGIANAMNVARKGDQRLTEAQMGDDAADFQTTGLGKAMGTFFRPMTATDAFLKTLNEGMEAYRLSYRQAKNEFDAGKLRHDGRSIRSRMIEIMSTPEQSFIDQVQQAGDYNTYNQKAGRIANLMESMKNLPEGTNPMVAGAWKLVMNTVIPFVRISTNAMKYGLERTIPGGLASTASGKGRLDRSERFAKMSEGALMLGGMWGAQQAGLIEVSGALPQDQDERDEWELQGKTPFSVRIGDRWYNPQAFPGLYENVTLLGMMGDAKRKADEKEQAGEEVGAGDYLSEIPGGIAQYLGQVGVRPAFGSVVDALSLMTAPNDREREFRAQRLKRSAVGQALPASGLMRQIGNVTDRTQREATTVPDIAASLYPFFRENLPERTNALGEAMESEGALNPLAGLTSSRRAREEEGLPRKYIGSESAAMDIRITRAITAVQDYKRDPRGYPRPTSEQTALYNRYNSRKNPRREALDKRVDAAKRRAERAREFDLEYGLADNFAFRAPGRLEELIGA